MATSRTYPSPVNLKERIAALQQRSVSPSQQQTSQFAAKNIPSSGPGGLRDKIAKFEEKGGVPVPRGSFVTGGPQLPENAPARKRGELYGNRIQSFGRPFGTPPSRSSSPLPPADGSPSPRKRCVSTGGALSKSPLPRFAADGPAPPLPPVPSLPSGRRNSLAVDFGCVVNSDKMSQRTGEDCESPPSSPSLSPSIRGEVSSIVSPSQSSPEPVTPPNGPLPQDIDVLLLAEKEPEVIEPASQGVSDLAPLTTLDMATTMSQSLPEAISVVEATSTVEADQIDGSASDELSKTSHHPALSNNFVSDTQRLEAALPGLPSTTSIVSIERVPAPNYPLVSITDASEFIPRANEGLDNVAEPSSTFETPITGESGIISTSVPHLKIQVQSSPPSSDQDTETTTAKVKHSFTAVVHRKVTEIPASTAPTSTLSAPITPQIARMRHMGISISAEPTSSPGYGELAILLEEAALLEKKLTEGDICAPSDLLQSAFLNTPTSSTFAPDVRSASSSTLTEHVKAPSTESASLSERSISIPSIREPNIGGDIPEEDEIDGRSLASTSASQRSPSHKKYLSSIRRLTGRRSSNYMPGAYPRDSISTCSEDSAAISTPSEYGDGSRDGFGIAWPSVSPKKGSTGRSSSFADKLFKRNRTKSNVSTAETDQSSIYESPTGLFTLSQPPSPSATKSSQGRHATEMQPTRSPHWAISRDSSSSPSSSIIDKEIFDAFPSVPQTLPPDAVHLSPDISEVGVRRLSAISVKSRKHQQQRLSVV